MSHLLGCCVAKIKSYSVLLMHDGGEFKSYRWSMSGSRDVFTNGYYQCYYTHTHTLRTFCCKSQWMEVSSLMWYQLARNGNHSGGQGFFLALVVVDDAVFSGQFASFSMFLYDDFPSNSMQDWRDGWYDAALSVCLLFPKYGSSKPRRKHGRQENKPDYQSQVRYLTISSPVRHGAFSLPRKRKKAGTIASHKKEESSETASTEKKQAIESGNKTKHQKQHDSSFSILFSFGFF